jgi:hypothetical protein
MLANAAVVRDLLTTDNEQRMLAQGQIGSISPTLKKDAVRVDAVVSTIGFPLVRRVAAEVLSLDSNSGCRRVYHHLHSCSAKAQHHVMQWCLRHACFGIWGFHKEILC